jgi:hypothetical protein
MAKVVTLHAMVNHSNLMRNGLTAKSIGGLVPHFKENQMKEKLIEWTLAVIIFGGIGVMLAWRG